MDWNALVQILAPIAAAALKPALVPLASLIVRGIADAEALFGTGAGPTKRAHAIGLAGDAVQAINDVTAAQGKPPLFDVTEVQATVGSVIDATVQAANVIDAAQKAAAATPPPAPAPAQ